MICPKCQAENRDTRKFCAKCGAPFVKKCPQCSSENLPGELFCGECGHDLRVSPEAAQIDYAQPQSYTPKHLADKILTSRNAMEGERKLVTVLFADVANFTSLSEKLEPEEVHKIMEGCLKILMDQIHKYEGTINQFTGDGVMALFGAPLAHEDHAQRACYAALAIQRDLADYSEKVRKDYGQEFRMRIGLNSGPVVVGSIGDDLHMDYTAIGDTINLGARVQQAATPGEVWMSQETRNLIQGYFRDEPKGEETLKGKAEAQSLYRLIGDKPEVRTRFEAGLARGIKDLVGRRPEMEALRVTFDRAKGGEAQVMDVVGEAGVGKSRLIYEFHKVVDQEALFLSGICLQYGRSINFLPVRDVVKEAFSLQEGMDEETVKDRIREQCDNNLIEFISFYHNLLSLTVTDDKFNSLNPEGRKFGTFEAIKSLLLSLNRHQPLVVFLEDVHWMDKISEEFFTYFSRCIQGHPVMMLSAYRPEVTPSWAHGAHYQKLGLETLSLNSSIRLVINLLGGLKLAPALEGKIAEKAGGNPFFMEEIVRELLERGDLVKEGNQYICRRPLDQIEIPSTIQGVIAARMDRLSENLKRTTQVASVIGRDFAYKILKSVMDLGEELRGYLTNLVGIELLYEKTIYPELEYIFKHSLIQDVAYESLLKQRRREIHGRIGRAIEDLYASKLEPHYEILAHHWELSGNAPRAIDYLIRAGEKSSKNMAAQAAFEFFGKALDLLKGSDKKLDPETEVKVRQGKGSSANDIGDIDTAIVEYRKAMDISRKEGMIDYEMSNLANLALCYWFSPLKPDEVIDFYNNALARVREVKNQSAESRVLSMKGMYLCSLGQRYQGNSITAQAERMALETHDLLSISQCRTNLAGTERWLGRPQRTIDLTEGLFESTRGVFNMTYLSAIIFLRAPALAECGRIREAMELLAFGIDNCEKFGGVVFLGRHYNCLGYCYGEIHNPQKAWDLNAKSEEIARRLMDQYPMGRPMAAEVVAQANVNLMENLYDMGKSDEAWKRLKSFEQESKGEDYWRARDRWEARMHVLAAEILIERNELGQAMGIIEKEMERAKREHLKKFEGRFLRLLGEVQIKSNQSDAAIANIKEAILILKEVGNRRQIWQAHASLAAAFAKMNRVGEAREQWQAAASIVHITADGLNEETLKKNFIEAASVQKILKEANI